MTYIPSIIFVFDRRKTASATTNGYVELRITLNKKQKFLATGIKLKSKEWRNGRVVNRLDASELNLVLDTMYRNVCRVVDNMLGEGRLNIDLIPAMLKAAQEPEPVEAPKASFVQYCEERAEVRKYGKSVDSQERYDRFIRFFKRWGGINTFDDLTEKNIIEMDKVISTKNLKDNSKWNNYHRFLNSFIIDAIDDGLIRRNPYKHVRINKDKDSKSLWKHLTPEELRKIEKVALPTECLRQVRDVFVFQVYTCLSYVDLVSFDWSKVKDLRGRKLYTGFRGKTNQEFTFMLVKPALEILKRYDGVLPTISNQKYNDFLKIIAYHAGIDKPISSHWARHTGATLLLNMGVDMEIVAKILGHSSTKITRAVYAKLLDETVVNAMADVEKKLARK